MKRLIWAGPAFAVFLIAAALRGADAPASGEDRIRGALRDTMLQLRSAQADLATAQAAQAALADENKALTSKLDALKKQLISERAASDKSSGTLSTQLAEAKAANAHLKQVLDKSHQESDTNAGEARTAEAANAKLKTQLILEQRKLSDLQSKNLALFLTGNEILSRYADFSLGDALKAKEPFISLTRTKLENMIQDYQDQLLDQRAK